MKKLLATLLAFLCTFAFASCVFGVDTVSDETVSSQKSSSSSSRQSSSKRKSSSSKKYSSIDEESSSEEESSEDDSTEIDSFLTLALYIIAYGEYDSSDNDYSLTFGPISYSGTYYTRVATYHPDTMEIDLAILAYQDSTSNYYFSLVLEDSNGTYDWYYLDSNDCFMKGTVYAPTFTQNSLLKYSSYSSIPTSTLLSSTQKLASSMLGLIVTFFDIDFSSTYLSREDFGFTAF